MAQGHPFLKWPGGKQRLLGKLLPLVPQGYSRYFEPFVGSGALFFALCPSGAVLSDINHDVMQAYAEVRDSVESVIRCLKKMQYSRREYYRIRSLRPRDPSQAAARLIYLTKTCWNGLYRVNQQGEFNVPLGRYRDPAICDPSTLRAASVALGNARLLAADFEEAIEGANKGDFVYLDPPYRTAATKNGFLKYNPQIFSWADQVRLAKAFRKLHGKGCYVLLSNANRTEIRELYKGFQQRVIFRRSLIAGDPSKRRLVTELVVTNF